jgi:transcriptional regulator with XRE-family HTH domain
MAGDIMARLTISPQMSERIQEARETAGLTQDQAGRHMGITQESWSKIENRTTKYLTRRKLQEIANTLGVEPKWIEDGKGIRTGATQLADPLTLAPAYMAAQEAPVSKPHALELKFYLGPKFREIRWDEKFPRSHPYAPSQEEYLSRTVVRAPCANEVIKRLQAEQWAMVLGRGASGKTVLAYLLTLDEELSASRSFYLNIADYPNPLSLVAPVAEEIFEAADPDALFIVDNIHINEDIAHDIWRVWSEIAAKPRLLLLGREVQTREGSRFSNSTTAPVLLLAREHETRGVFERLARRVLPAPQKVPQVPDNVVAQWMETFGGPLNSSSTTVDLVMLSAAIRRKLPQLVAGKWLLVATDAQDEVRAEYLDVSDSERRNLLRLSALPDDFSIPQISLPDPYVGFPESTKSGIVFETFNNNYGLRYGFAHAALGHLIAATHNNPPFFEAERIAIVQSDPTLALWAANQFVLQRRLDAATLLLDKLMRVEEWIGGYRGNLVNLTRPWVRLASVSAAREELATGLANDSHALGKMIEKTSLHDLLEFYRLVDTAGLTRLRNVITAALPDYMPLLMSKVPDTDLDKLASLISHLQSDPQTFSQLRHALIDYLEHNKDHFLSFALHASLSELTGFMKEIDQPDLQPLRNVLIAKLGESDSLAVLADKAVTSSFDFVMGFLNFAATEPRLVKVRSYLIDRLQEPRMVKVLAARACRETWTSLLSLFSVPGLSDKIVLAIQKDAWDSARAAERAVRPDFFASLAIRLRNLGRPELAQVPARVVMREANSQHWTTHTVHVRHLSHLLSLASPTSKDEQRRFLDKVLMPEWLDRQYEKASAGSLAGAIFSLLVSLDQENWQKFALPALGERAWRELSRINGEDLEHCAEALSLFGMAYAINPDFARVRQFLPIGSQWMNRIILMSNPSPHQSRITIRQMQLWLGVRALVRLQAAPIKLEEYLGDCMLGVIRVSIPQAQKTGGFTSQLHNWLEASAKNDWILARAQSGES